MRRRNRKSQLRVITRLGLFMAIALAGFFAWRVTRGQWVLATLDAVVVIVLVALVYLARRRGELDLAGALMCVLNAGFCLAAAWLIGPAANGWIYLALISNFYIAPPRVAIVASAALIAAAAVILLSRGVTADTITVLVTWTLVSVCTYSFAHNLHVQQESLVELASLDALTQAPNRRQMEADLEGALRDARAGEAGLLVLDIDNFKLVNDTHGHAQGDDVLQGLADVLRAQLRGGDQVYRFGGEEFVLLIQAPTRPALEATAERIRKAVETSSLGAAVPVTVSIGGALFDNETAWQDWFSRADAALYEAKRSGRNRVCMAVTAIA